MKVSGTAITQANPFKNTRLVTTAGSSQVHRPAQGSGGDGPVTFVTTSKSTPRGAKTTIRVSRPAPSRPRELSIAGSYTASGTDVDATVTSGTWSLPLNVTGSKVLN